MSHSDPEVLALRALGEDAGTAEDQAHLAQCARCDAELRQLAALVTVARSAEPDSPLEVPPPAVWTRIAAAKGVSTVPADTARADAALADMTLADMTLADGGPAGPAPAGTGNHGATKDDLGEGGAERVTSARQRRHRAAEPGRRERLPWWRRRPLAAVLAGAAAGLIIGAGAVAATGQLGSHPRPAAVATIALRPLAEFPQWHGASGTAVMHRGPSGPVLTVSLHAPRRPGFYEVWLLARNGVSMISLGDLDSRHKGAFAMPPGVDLRNYSRVDISLQPFNGSPAHSRTSVVRGSLPT
ncbi:MAG: anti-sigma factor [Streptosporangiaceae bacterium]